MEKIKTLEEEIKEKEEELKALKNKKELEDKERIEKEKEAKRQEDEDFYNNICKDYDEYWLEQKELDQFIEKKEQEFIELKKTEYKKLDDSRAEIKKKILKYLETHARFTYESKNKDYKLVYYRDRWGNLYYKSFYKD